MGCISRTFRPPRSLQRTSGSRSASSVSDRRPPRVLTRSTVEGAQRTVGESSARSRTEKQTDVKVKCGERYTDMSAFRARTGDNMQGVSVSKENVAIVKRFEELLIPSFKDGDASSHGGFDQVLELLDPAFSAPVCPSLPHGGHWVGHDGFLKMCEAVRNTRRTIEHSERTYLDAGEDSVVMTVSFTAESSQTPGGPFPVRMVEIFTVRDSKSPSSFPYYWDAAPAIEAERDEASL